MSLSESPHSVFNCFPPDKIQIYTKNTLQKSSSLVWILIEQPTEGCRSKYLHIFCFQTTFRLRYGTWCKVITWRSLGVTIQDLTNSVPCSCSGSYPVIALPNDACCCSCHWRPQRWCSTRFTWKHFLRTPNTGNNTLYTSFLRLHPTNSEAFFGQ